MSKVVWKSTISSNSCWSFTQCRTPDTFQPKEILGIVKKITSIKILEEYQNIKELLWAGNFWDQEENVNTINGSNNLEDINRDVIGSCKPSNPIEFVNFN